MDSCSGIDSTALGYPNSHELKELDVVSFDVKSSQSPRVGGPTRKTVLLKVVENETSSANNFS